MSTKHVLLVFLSGLIGLLRYWSDNLSAQGLVAIAASALEIYAGC